jgi:L-amino acid N-acyltransferase YncA
MSPLIRPATPGDLPAVADIYAHYVRTAVATFEEIPPEPAYWEQRLADTRLPFLVAAADGEILGYTFAAAWKPRPAYRHTVEDSVYIAPGALGQGLGTVLLGALLDACVRAEVRQVIAVIADGSGEGRASVALHSRFGFVPVGTLRSVGRKFGRWLDTSLMQRDLVP